MGKICCCFEKGTAEYIFHCRGVSPKGTKNKKFYNQLVKKIQKKIYSKDNVMLIRVDMT
jgi:hypothetical protein